MPSARFVENVAHRPLFVLQLPHGGDGTFAVANDEQPPTVLRNSEFGGIQNVFGKMKPEASQAVLQFPVARPGPHVDNVFENDPPGPEFLREPQRLEGCGATLSSVRPGGGPFGAGVVSALRGCQKQIDVAD